MDFPNSDFWNYSSQLWTLPNVENQCLLLQNQHELNVNLILFCCWTGDQGYSLNRDDIETLLGTASSWENVIKPLRDTRRMMKQNLLAMPAEIADQTLENISEMELNTERMEQLALEKAIPLTQLSHSDSSHVECALLNIRCYLASLPDGPDSEQLNGELNQLLTDIFQDAEAVQIAMMSSMA